MRSKRSWTCAVGWRSTVGKNPFPHAPRRPPLSAVSLILPASNEAAHIGPCLAALAAQADPGVPVEVIVVANGCRDDTAAQACAAGQGLRARGWALRVIERAEGGKLAALNAGDDAAIHPIRVYLDADILCAPELLPALVRALDVPQPRYATGRLCVRRARTAVTRAYARFWQTVPFVQGGGVGTGLYAVNAAGRARWGRFPDIISDDTFVRIQFTPAERIEVDAWYDWPMVEGFARLVRVRRRQDRGVADLARTYPDLMANEGKAPMPPGGLRTRALRDPVAFAVYGAVALAVRLFPSDGTWARGR